MSDIYKIETYSESCANKIEKFILSMGGRCVVQGWAVITDYNFNSQKSLHLLPIISRISEDVSETDISCWENEILFAA